MATSATPRLPILLSVARAAAACGQTAILAWVQAKCSDGGEDVRKASLKGAVQAGNLTLAKKFYAAGDSDRDTDAELCQIAAAAGSIPALEWLASMGTVSECSFADEWVCTIIGCLQYSRGLRSIYKLLVNPHEHLNRSVACVSLCFSLLIAQLIM